jgi:CAP12/Pycsar effector protein, TIR domain
MDKPRIFLGSSGMQKKLLDALTRSLEDVAHVDPWTTSFNPGTTTLLRLFELAHEVDFAAFAFARDDWTAAGQPASPPTGSGQASPRDNVVFEAGLFGGVLGMHRTFILHAKGSKLPSDLLGFTCVRYDEAATPSEMRVINQKLRKAIESEGRVARIEGLWWQFSLTARGPHEKEPSGVFYYWKGERPRDLNAPQLDGTGEILLESADRAAGHFTTRSEAPASAIARTAGVYWRADPEDCAPIMDGNDERRRAKLIAEQLKRWKSITNA